MKAIKITLSGRYGHYGRLEGTVVNQTYKVPTKTALKGMIAAILGLDRDSYYDKISNFKVSIVPKNIRTQVFGILDMSTNDQVQTKNNVTMVPPEKSKHNRQLSNYEVLVNPEYTIYFQFDEPEFSKLQQMLLEGKSVYTPSLGLSEFIADIKYEGVVNLNETDNKFSHSTVKEEYVTNTQSEGSIMFERIADGFETDSNGRYPSGFMNIIIPEPNETLDFKFKDSTKQNVVSDDTNKLLFY